MNTSSAAQVNASENASADSSKEASAPEKIVVAESASNKEENNKNNEENSSSKSTNEEIKRAVENLNKEMINQNSEAIFGIHDKTNRITIKIVDKTTKEVIKELPPEKTLDMLARVWEMAGILVDEKR
ncbi:MAG: flagellar protein FlaG [Lachnospiraceae bacterium]|nr:flagellar protein FlaG [Lachnospiraceae bacterium]